MSEKDRNPAARCFPDRTAPKPDSLGRSLDRLMSVLDAIDDEATAGLNDPSLDDQDSQAQYALQSIKRIAEKGHSEIKKILLALTREVKPINLQKSEVTLTA